MKIAVIGSGISGLSAAHYLSKKYKVDLFEKNDHFGGHSYTTEVYENSSNEKISMDLGFIVFNKVNYPNLLNLFRELEIKYEISNMSFSVSVKNSNIEYSASGLKGLFANKYNILSPSFIKMIREIFFFYKMADKMSKESFEIQTLGEFLKSKKCQIILLDTISSLWFRLYGLCPPNKYMRCLCRFS